MKKDIKHVIPGFSACLASIDLLNSKPKSYSNDTQNRAYVIRTIIKDIKDGLSEEEALDKMMKNPIIKEFDYFEKYNIDVKEKIRDWVKREIKKPRRQNGLDR